MISCMRVNDNENGLEFFEFIVLISYVYFVDGCQGGGIGFFCVECKYLIVLSCFPGRVYPHYYWKDPRAYEMSRVSTSHGGLY